MRITGGWNNFGPAPSPVPGNTKSLFRGSFRSRTRFALRSSYYVYILSTANISNISSSILDFSAILNPQAPAIPTLSCGLPAQRIFRNMRQRDLLSLVTAQGYQ